MGREGIPRRDTRATYVLYIASLNFDWMDIVVVVTCYILANVRCVQAGP